MRYIDKLIYEIAKEEAYNESKRVKRILFFTAGFFVGLVFWAVIIIEFYTFAPIK